jgi:hypothetical protein
VVEEFLYIYIPKSGRWKHDLRRIQNKTKKKQNMICPGLSGDGSLLLLKKTMKQ